MGFGGAIAAVVIMLCSSSFVVRTAFGVHGSAVQGLDSAGSLIHARLAGNAKALGLWYRGKGQLDAVGGKREIEFDSPMFDDSES